MKILITAGPTRESLDPVRFISNRSTGEMGFAIAKAAKRRGHKVILISGPTHLAPPKGVKFFSVQTARQMQKEILNNFSSAESVVMAAAVSDYRPAKESRVKIKKSKNILNLKLIKNPDILEVLGRSKGKKILVGFALETGGLYKNALKKLKEKKLDFIVANQLTKKQNVFGTGKTNVLIIDKNGNKAHLRSVTKDEVAEEIVSRIENLTNWTNWTNWTN